ncbi:type I-F CRISPR-associated protein Csy1 [Dickeya fangzhongdai]|uniref:Type I-F CRISPR-associated protein Csy1 n=1 Tax=Dickeya fangzhongdai TaxID=1778540 RepID=A0A2K8QSM0_9GAMM|nr:type I-F CRISPR-associated protein Csy1 [Dickeya fangzhongdai]ATZ95750.1 type I-F CRISPR-associated protein Csy1 [Dickeya fangzhongdai]QOH49195.1 type I-F CRISPR-associated protein Csy1 [Dickeya fangzhongdai]QOH53498.1 type I-F CRISPR-associated protein Csy1 [Dickeya fangzhongdai]WOY02439.1 type I-F CRISPR-associated protein Csy1 [Dickeya fangzhongdai]WOY06645.1 type I-F CRISPR-associated protein Csy1 [Dickeya fangzhongdai]
MEESELRQFIVSYIENRKQAKLDAFDKAADKQRAALSGEALAAAELTLVQKRRKIEHAYEVRTWLTDAASKASQIKRATHVLKFTHSSAKGSSRLDLFKDLSLPFLSTASLSHPILDTAVDNAAVLGIATFLTEEHQGNSLVAALQRGDHRSLGALAENPQQLAQWLAGFKQVLSDKQPSSHSLAKQIYFPVGDGEYHLLSPLYSSSLSQALDQRLNAVRFGEQAKAIREARRQKRWHDEVDVNYPGIAVQNMGGDNKQNVSALNVKRNGRSYLFNCSPPQWRSQDKPPVEHDTIFRNSGELYTRTRDQLSAMRKFLLSVKEVDNNREIRNQRRRYLDQLIDTLFGYVATVQNLRPAGWSVDSRLNVPLQLWLDPLRGLQDKDFLRERDAGDWQREVAYEFGRWLNARLQHEKLIFGEVERREWSTAALFKQRLRETERLLKEELA